MYFGDLLLRLGIWIAGLTVGSVWIYALAKSMLPRLGDVLTCFVVTPGGIVFVLLLWRALGRRPEKKKS